MPTGPNRFFWGTDITRMPCSYRQCVTFFTEELPWLKGQDLEKVMGRGLCEVDRLELQILVRFEKESLCQRLSIPVRSAMTES